MTVTPKPWISVVVPIKDERDNLHPLTNQLTKVLGALEQSQAAPFEIVYVDDGSTDGSSTLLDEITQQTPDVQVVHFDRNHGQTAAFDAGFRHARGELIATLDGDLQYDPADIAKLLPFTKDFDLVCGRRQKRLDNIIRQLSSRTAYWIRNAVIHDGIHDTGCSLKIFRRSVIERMALFHNMHRFFSGPCQDVRVFGHRSARPTFPTCPWAFQIRHWESPLCRPVRPDRRSVDAETLFSIYNHQHTERFL